MTELNAIIGVSCIFPLFLFFLYLWDISWLMFSFLLSFVLFIVLALKSSLNYNPRLFFTPTTPLISHYHIRPSFIPYSNLPCICESLLKYLLDLFALQQQQQQGLQQLLVSFPPINIFYNLIFFTCKTWIYFDVPKFLYISTPQFLVCFFMIFVKKNFFWPHKTWIFLMLLNSNIL